MEKYKIVYLTDQEQNIAYVQGNNKAEASRAFKDEYSDAAVDSILSVEKANTTNTEHIEHNDYKTAIFISMITSIVGWIAVAVGVALSVGLLYQGGMAILGLSSTITILLVGLLLVVSGQASRAVMDNANYSRLMLEIAQKNSLKA